MKITTPTASSGATTAPWSRYRLRHSGPLIALLLLIGFNALITPNFLSMQTLSVNITQVATIAIVAMGMTLVIATGGIDLSVGAVMALAGAIVPLIFLSSAGQSFPVLMTLIAVMAALSIAMMCGLFNGMLVSRFGVQPIVATLILFISGRGLAQVLTNGNLQTFDNPMFEYLGSGRLLGVPIQGWLVILIAAIAVFVVSRTRFGRYLLASGGNPRAAELAGVPVARVRMVAYTLCALLAGLAGMISVAINSASDAARNGQLMELDAIAAAVVGGALLQGGRAPFIGVVIGAAIIQLVRYTLLANGVPDEVALIVKAAIIVGAVYLQSLRGGH